jgi:hypothetical protein
MDRLQRLEDLMDIRELRNRYCHYIDTEQWDRAADLFTEDGSFHGFRIADGRDAVRQWFADSVPGAHAKAWHMCTNATTFLEGDRAHGTVAFTFYCVERGVSKLALGYYEDEMVRGEGSWLFRSRRVHFDFFVPWSEGFAAAFAARQGSLARPS